MAPSISGIRFCVESSFTRRSCQINSSPLDSVKVIQSVAKDLLHDRRTVEEQISHFVRDDPNSFDTPLFLQTIYFRFIGTRAFVSVLH